MKHKLEPTSDNFYKAIVVLMGSLVWVVKPAALVLRESANKPATVQSALDAEKLYTEKKRASEKADADAKEKGALVAQCKEAIANYNPTRNTRVGPAYDARERVDAQALWTKSLSEAEKRDVVYMRAYTKSLVDAIAKRYADREAASERL